MQIIRLLIGGIYLEILRFYQFKNLISNKQTISFYTLILG